MVERLGSAFFRELPRGPGVYLMHGRAGRPPRARVLYVGKARDLRRRLASYRHVRADRDSRKTLRLVRSVQTITWEPCADESAAMLRENDLLRQHRPLFNRANVRPEAHGYIGVAFPGSSMRLRLGMSPDNEGHWFGAFKGIRRHAAVALARTLFQFHNEIERWDELPRDFLKDRAPVNCEWVCPFTPESRRLLLCYFSGRNGELVDRLASALCSAPTGRFLDNWRASDLDLLRRFYVCGPRRNFRWRECLGLADDTVFGPVDIEDLPVKVRLPREPYPWNEASAMNA